jgi:hypothetical protein
MTACHFVFWWVALANAKLSDSYSCCIVQGDQNGLSLTGPVDSIYDAMGVTTIDLNEAHGHVGLLSPASCGNDFLMCTPYPTGDWNVRKDDDGGALPYDTWYYLNTASGNLKTKCWTGTQWAEFTGGVSRSPYAGWSNFFTAEWMDDFDNKLQYEEMQIYASGVSVPVDPDSGCFDNGGGGPCCTDDDADDICDDRDPFLDNDDDFQWSVTMYQETSGYKSLDFKHTDSNGLLTVITRTVGTYDPDEALRLNMIYNWDDAAAYKTWLGTMCSEDEGPFSTPGVNVGSGGINPGGTYPGSGDYTGGTTGGSTDSEKLGNIEGNTGAVADNLGQVGESLGLLGETSAVTAAQTGKAANLLEEMNEKMDVPDPSGALGDLDSSWDLSDVEDAVDTGLTSANMPSNSLDSVKTPLISLFPTVGSCSPLDFGTFGGEDFIIPCTVSEKIKTIGGWMIAIFTIVYCFTAIYSEVRPGGGNVS